MADRDAWRRMEQLKLEEEEERIRSYKNVVDNRQEEERIQRQLKLEQRNKLLEEQSKELAKRRLEEEQLEEMLNELYKEEQEERERMREIAERERRLRQKQEMIQANEYQKQLKMRLQEQEKRDEELFRQMMMEKFEDDERIAQLGAQRRHQKMIEFRRDVENLMEERRRMRELERQHELAEYEVEQKEKAKKQAIIEQERKRLIQEHVSKILKYLPKGVLSKKDLSLLPEDVQQQILNAPKDPFAYSR